MSTMTDPRSGGCESETAGDLGQRRLRRDRNPDRSCRRAARRRCRPARRLHRPRRRDRERQRRHRRRAPRLPRDGIDYVPSLLERGRERAAAERVAIELSRRRRRGDPVPGRLLRRNALGLRLDVLSRTSRGQPASLPGSPGPAGRSRSRAGRRTASSARCSRPSGHTSRRRRASPRRCSGAPRTILAELFAPDVDWTHERRTFTFRFTSAQAFVDTFGEYYGPTVKALEAAGADRDALVSDLHDLAAEWNRLEQPGAGRDPRRLPGVGRHAPLSECRTK